MLVKTGIGYFVKDGKIIAKYDLPLGVHKDPPEGVTFVELQSRKELDAIEVVVEKSEKTLINELIRNKIREMAISELKKEGKLSDEYSE